MESARVQLSGNRIKAYGRIVAAASATHPAFSASYDLVTDESGATKRLSLSITLAERERQLSIARDEENMWLITDHQGDPVAPTDGALDVDVVLSPFFNALPIRRTGLHRTVRYGDAAGGLRQPARPARSARPSITYSSSGLDGAGHQAAFAGGRHDHHRRRRRIHPRLSGPCNADLITPPARPAAASSSRQFSSPRAIVTICGREKLSYRARAACPASTSSATEFFSASGARAGSAGASARSRARHAAASAFASHIARTRSGAGTGDAGAVTEGSGRRREGQRNLARGDGERLGQQMRQVRSGRPLRRARLTRPETRPLRRRARDP